MSCQIVYLYSASFELVFFSFFYKNLIQTNYSKCLMKIYIADNMGKWPNYSGEAKKLIVL